MTPEQVLSHAPRVLTQEQRESYFQNGYVVIEKLITDEWLQRLRETAAHFVDLSREQTESGATYDLAPGHTAESPRLRRLKTPVDQDPVFWEFATDVIADVAADLVGPDVVFHHAKLNYKWNDGNDDVKWHQDIQFYPHTNYSPLTIGTYLNDTGMPEGPVAVIPQSHNGELFDQYDHNGTWTGCLSDDDTRKLNLDSAQYLEAPAGSITAHNCRTVHGSPPSTSDGGRPLLLNAFASADAFTYTKNPQPSAYAGKVVRGKAARWAHHDPRPCLIPPDWSGGYTSIFAAQAGEDG